MNSVANLPVGSYAVSLFHDRNQDGVLNRGELGIPSEGFGFSNNAPSAQVLPNLEMRWSSWLVQPPLPCKSATPWIRLSPIPTHSQESGRLLGTVILLASHS